MSIPTPLINQFGLKDLKDQIFGYLTVIAYANKDQKSGKHQWTCICKCGKKIVVRHDYLIHTNCPKTHCGCKNKGPSVLRPLEYAVWQMMMMRCNNKSHVAYHHYGGRGIKVCERWHDFWKFVEDMGPRKDREWSLERKDPNKGYEPSNCIWLKKSLQGRNRRNTVYIDHPQTGKKVPAAEVAEYLGISYQAMRAQYIARGEWPTAKTVIEVRESSLVTIEDKNVVDN